MTRPQGGNAVEYEPDDERDMVSDGNRPRWNERLATEEDLERIFGRGGLFIGPVVKPLSQASGTGAREDRTSEAEIESTLTESSSTVLRACGRAGSRMRTMNDAFSLHRFVKVQDADGAYVKALAELRSGRKTNHWMWFVFPQIAGLGRSAMSQRYAISSLDE